MTISITMGAIMSATMGGTEVTPDLQARLEAAEARIAELSAQQDADWMTEQRSEQIRGLVQDVLSDADTRASLQGDGSTSGYNDGFYMQSADGKWSMKINGLFQERFNVGSGRNSAAGTHQGAGEGDLGTNYTTVFGFETTRAALNFSGTLAGDIFYNARLNWSPYNSGTPSGVNGRNGSGISDSPLEWAYGGFSLNDNMKVQMGRQKYDVQRSFMVNAEHQMTIERAGTTYYWMTSNITNGVKLTYDNNNLRGNVMFSNGAGAGDNANNAGAATASYTNNNHGWAVSGRAEMLFQGDWSQFDNIGSKRGEAMGVMGGFGAAYVKNSQRDAAGDVSNNWLITADVSIHNDGWSLAASGTYGQNRNSNAQNNENSFGFQVLGGYWLNDTDQAYAQWQWLYPGTGAGAVSSRANILSLGLNHHMGGNVKLSIDWNWAFSDSTTAAAQGNTGGYGYTGWWTSTVATSGSQWLLRTQLQVAF